MSNDTSDDEEHGSSGSKTGPIDTAVGISSGAAVGSLIGIVAGPIGAIVGGILGAAFGEIAQRSRKKP